MAERLKAAVLKTVSGVTHSGVRIPLPPPRFPALNHLVGWNSWCGEAATWPGSAPIRWGLPGRGVHRLDAASSDGPPFQPPPVKRDAGPHDLDQSEGPGSLQKAINRSQYTATGKRQDTPVVPLLKGIEQQHQRYRREPEYRQAIHCPSVPFIPAGQSRFAQPEPFAAARVPQSARQRTALRCILLDMIQAIRGAHGNHWRLRQCRLPCPQAIPDHGKVRLPTASRSCSSAVRYAAIVCRQASWVAR